MSNPDDILNTPEACVYLGGTSDPIAEYTMRIWRVRGTGPVYRKVNGRVRYLRSDLDKFLEDCKRTKTNGSRSMESKPLGPVQQKRAEFWARQNATDTQHAADAQRADRNAVAA